MNAKLTFFAVGCAAVAAIGCHHRTVHIKVQGITATVKPDPIEIKNFDHDGNFTVTWKEPASSKAWLVEFDPKDNPCRQSFVIQKSAQEECVINRKEIIDNHYYKYFAFADAAHSQDPGIAHGTGRTKPPPPPSVPPVTLFCLDLSTGVPGYCENGDPPQKPQTADPLAGVSPLDDIFWRANADWTISIDGASPCVQTQISAKSQPYCTVKREATQPTYNYHVTVNGMTKGPFQIQMK